MAQHTKPCGDCPWRRNAVPGWLGSLPAEAWVREAHGETRIDCHESNSGAQCVGVAIYRANVLKVPRSPKILRAEKDRESVFASPMEFVTYHEMGGKGA